MRTVFSNLTALMLIIHGMFGCCHCHWHSAEECGWTSVASTCDCCRHESHHDTVPEPPCDGKVKCEGLCTYLPTPRSLVDANTAAWELNLVADVAAVCHHFDAAVTLPSQSSCTCDAPPPLPLNLLQQRLLI